MTQVTAGDVRSATGLSAETVGVSATQTFVTMSSTNQSSRGVGMTVTKVVKLSAAHHLPNHPGKCKFHHGHNYKVEVTCKGPIDLDTGMVKDFGDIETDCEAIILVYDHTDLNVSIPEMLTTAENLASFWLGALVRVDPMYSSVTVWETDDCYARASLI